MTSTLDAGLDLREVAVHLYATTATVTGGVVIGVSDLDLTDLR